MKKLIIGIFLIIIIIVVAFFAVSGITNLGVENYKVTVKGTVYYSTWPGPGWGVTYSSREITEDSWASFQYMPWETKDVHIVVELTGESGSYRGETDIGTLGNILDSRDFAVEVRHVVSGSYNGEAQVYEVEEMLGWFERSRVLRATTSFSVTVP